MKFCEINKWAVANVAVNAAFLGCVHQSSHLASRVHYFSWGVFVLGGLSCASSVGHLFRTFSAEADEWLGENIHDTVHKVGFFSLFLILPALAISINRKCIPNQPLIKIPNGSVNWETSFYQHWLQLFTLTSALANSCAVFTAYDRFAKMTGAVFSLSYLGTIKTIAGWKMIRAVFSRDLPDSPNVKFAFSYLFSVVDVKNPVVFKEGKALSYATVVNEFVQKMQALPLTRETFQIGDRWETHYRSYMIGRQTIVIPEQVLVHFCHFWIPKKYAIEKLSSYSRFFIDLIEWGNTTRASLTFQS
ncbi:MAG: hypothetical protein ChlgKO_00230 [Chlamydiales bacterium]